MGWTWMHRKPGQTTAQVMLAEYAEGTVFHASAVVDGVFYAAVETPTRPGVIWALVVLTGRSPNAYLNFGYKDMDETMGPNEARCPARVLDLLTPTDSTYAVEWRQECRDNIAITPPRFQVGDVVELVRPLEFANGDVLDTFTLQKGQSGRGLDLCAGGRRYRVRNWEWQVVAYTRGGVRTITARGARLPEDAYVARVVKAVQEHPADAEVRYGDRTRSWHALKPQARREFRAGDLWALAAAEEVAA